MFKSVRGYIKKALYYLTVLGLASIITLSCAWALAYAQKTMEESVASYAKPPAPPPEIPFLDIPYNYQLGLRDVVSLANLIKISYINPITDQEIIKNIHKGLVKETGPYCFYRVKSNQAPDNKSCGFYYTEDLGHYRITYIPPKSTAEKSGLMEDDEIVAINGNNILHTKSGFHKDFFTKSESPVFVIIRQRQKITIKVLKDDTYMPSVLSKIFSGILYIKMNDFDVSTGVEFLNCIGKYPNVSSYILDLRDNPGGDLIIGQCITSYFLESGTPLISRMDKDGKLSHIVANMPDSCTDKPLVVLINGNSASCSEIVAAVLKYYKRAIIVGEQSRGKGVSQTVFQLKNGDEVWIPSKRLFLPNNTTWDGNGVVPDYEVRDISYILSFNKTVPENDPILKKALSVLNNKQKTK